MTLPHPTADQITLSNVLAALGDPTRLAIVGYLARREGRPTMCLNFTDFGSKTNISYHLAKLREAGITRTEVSGTSRLITLRRDDLDSRFPGLLDSIVAAAVDMPMVKTIEDAAEEALAQGVDNSHVRRGTDRGLDDSAARLLRRAKIAAAR